MKTKHISVVSLSALLFLAPGFPAAGQDVAASSIDESGGLVDKATTATYYDDPDWVLARDFRPYINLRSDHKCMPLTFKETYGDFNTSHGDSYSGSDLSDLQDFCRDSFSSDFVVVANVVRSSTRSETFRITYGIAFGKQYSHLQGVYDTVETLLRVNGIDNFVGDFEDSIGTHGKDAQYIVVDVVDGELTSVWADLHQGNYVFPREWLTMTGDGRHVHLYAGKYYNSLKLDDWTVTARDVVINNENYSGGITDSTVKALETISLRDKLDYYMNFGDPTGSDYGGYGKLVMATNACADGITSYTSEVDGAIYSGDSLTALQGYIGCDGASTPNVWSESYMMQKSCYTGPYSLKGCKSGEMDGGDVCNASIDADVNTWTTFSGTNVYMEPWVAGRPRLYRPNGSGFNDMPVKGGTPPTSITILTDSGVNMVSTTYTDGTELSHGGIDGSQDTLSGLATDPVVSVTMCDGEREDDGDVRAGYIKLTTASGRTMEGGEGENCVTIAPSGKQLYGFYGRAESKLDVLGTYWGARITAPSASNVSLTISATTATGAYTFTDPIGLADSSTYVWMRASSTSEAGTIFQTGGSTTHALETSDYQKYLRFCVNPSNGYFTGSQVCSSWVYVSDVMPTVSNASLTVSGNEAIGSYTLSGLADSLTYEWWRTSDTSQTGSIIEGTATTYTLKGLDNNKYLRFCVTPNRGTYSGTKSCSGWISVGHLVSFFAKTNLEGQELHVPYEKSIWGTCFNMSTYSLDDNTSSLKLRAPTAHKATLWLFKGANCSGDQVGITASADTTESVSYIDLRLGSQWDNAISSFKVVPSNTPSVSNVSLAISGNAVTGSYTFTDAASLSDSSTYAWQRTTDTSQTGTTVGTSTSYTLSASDNHAYLRFCVTPYNGYVTGTQVCSSWTSVGRIISFFENSDSGGSAVHVAYEPSGSGHCFNMSSYGLDNLMSSFVLRTPTSNGATVWLYKDASCSGSVATWSVPANQVSTVSWIGGQMGSGWNDAVSSFKVTW